MTKNGHYFWRGVFFTKFDMRRPYQHIALDSDNRRFNQCTSWSFHFQKLPPGVSSTSDIFQKVIDNMVMGIPHSTVFLYNNLIAGTTKSIFCLCVQFWPAYTRHGARCRHCIQTSNKSRTLLGDKNVDHSDVVEQRLSAVLQLHLHFRLNTWLQWIGLRQLQDETRNIWVLGFDASYSRDLTVVLRVFFGVCQLVSFSNLSNPQTFSGCLLYWKCVTHNRCNNDDWNKHVKHTTSNRWVVSSHRKEYGNVQENMIAFWTIWSYLGWHITPFTSLPYPL